MTTMTDFIRPPKSHYLTYRIARGEQGVLTYEPYKSYLLPYWRFRTVPIAQTSSSSLYQKFLEFYEQKDFVGMDMTRKFIQMGMTRAKRYANHKGGRKYGKDGKEIERSKGHAGKEEKEEASRIFKEVWEKCREHEGYKDLKEEFLKEQRECDETHKNEVKEVKEEGAKAHYVETEERDEPPPKRAKRRVKQKFD